MPEPPDVARLPIPNEESLDEDIRRYLRAAEERLGFVPNVLRAYTLRPAKFRTFTAFYNQLMTDEEDCRLTRLEREMIAVVVSSANRCHYCLVAHGQAVRQLSGDPALGETLVTNYRAAPLDPRRQAMLDFAWKLTLAPDEIAEADRERLREVGFGDEEIFDICDVAACFNYTNRMADGLELVPNPEYYGRSR